MEGLWARGPAGRRQPSDALATWGMSWAFVVLCGRGRTLKDLQLGEEAYSNVVTGDHRLKLMLGARLVLGCTGFSLQVWLYHARDHVQRLTDWSSSSIHCAGSDTGVVFVLTVKWSCLEDCSP